MRLSLSQALFAYSQYIRPHHPLSRLMGLLTESRIRWWKNSFTRWFIHHYKVDMSEAVNSDPCGYESFNDFFTRALKPDVRPFPGEPGAIIAPADGVISQFGSMDGGRLIQAKGHDYSVVDLLGGDEAMASSFQGGQFATIYLSPRDYHRLHMPIAGRLVSMVHIPGRLFSVNSATTAMIPNLFARNERVVALFETEIGPMALVLVGAIFVASIETVWHGVVSPPTRLEIQRWDYQDQSIEFKTGDEMGRFKLGSTIIALFGKEALQWHESLTAGGSIQLGATVGTASLPI